VAPETRFDARFAKDAPDVREPGVRMKQALKLILGLLVLAIGAGAFWWVGARNGWFGHERDAGPISGKALPAEVVAARGCDRPDPVR
jgi:hypothetical protein